MDKLDEDTKEWIQVLLGFIERLLDIQDIHLHFTEDIDLFNRNINLDHQVKLNKNGGGVNRGTGLIWVNYADAKNKTNLLNILLHEAIHIKYPKMSEKNVEKLADYLARIR